MKQLMAQLKIRMDQSAADKDGLVRLLKTFYSGSRKIDGEPIFDAAVKFLGTNLNTTEDFSSLADFVYAFPDVYRKEDIEKLRQKFTAYCDEYDSSWHDSPDDLRYAADDLERIGSRLEVDVDAVCTRLNEDATEWEIKNEEEDREFDYEPDEYFPERQSTPEPIESMFEALLADLEERSI